MILLNEIVEVFALPDLDAFVFVNIVLLNTSDIGSALIDIDKTGLATGADSFVKETPNCLRITLRSEQEINSLALLVDGAIKVFPLAFDFDVGFIEPPTKTVPFLVLA